MAARAVASGWRGESPVVVINGWVASSRGAGPVGFTVGVGLDLGVGMRISFPGFRWFLGVLTSATQFTLAPLNSRPSSFSTAVFRSFAVSNSTNLVDKTGVNEVLSLEAA